MSGGTVSAYRRVPGGLHEGHRGRQGPLSSPKNPKSAREASAYVSHSQPRRSCANEAVPKAAFCKRGQCVYFLPRHQRPHSLFLPPSILTIPLRITRVRVLKHHGS